MTLCNLCCNILFNSIIFHLKLVSVSIHSVKIFYIIPLDPRFHPMIQLLESHHIRPGGDFSLVIYQGSEVRLHLDRLGKSNIS